jgi:multidrug transporter EmrE-like cation transporter
MKGSFFLAAAIVLEVFGSAMLKISAGFTLFWPSLGVTIGYTASFYYFGLALKYLPLSTAYAVWAGMGTALTALVGIMLFHEDISILKTIAFLTIIAGVVILNKSKEEVQEEATEQSGQASG